MELYDFFKDTPSYENQITQLLFRFLIKHEYDTPHLNVQLKDDVNTECLEVCGKGSFGTIYKKDWYCIKEIDKHILKGGACEFTPFLI